MSATGTAPPAVSVVIPCYNLGAYLDQAVQSVLDQTFDDLEILVVDDGSTDPATRLLFASYRRPRTRVIRTENRGLARTRNLGIQQARGRFVCCLDSDDLLEPTFLEKAVAALEKDSQLGFVSCWLTAFGEMSFTWTPASCDFPVLLSECTVCTASLQRRDAVLAAGGYDPEMPLPGYEDWDLAIGLVERGRPGVILPEPLFQYRIRKGSMSVQCMEPSNHRRLLAYMVAKHAESYRRYAPELLQITEERTARLARETPQRPHAIDGRSDAGSTQATLTADGVGAAKAELRPVTAVVTPRNGWSGLFDTLRALQAQSAGCGPVILVEDPEAPLDDVSRRAAEAVSARVVRSARAGPRARAEGLAAVRTAYVVALESGDVPHRDLYSTALQALERDPGAAFVSFCVVESGTGFEWTGDSDPAVDALAAYVAAFPIVRVDVLRDVGGYATDLPSCHASDRDVLVRLAVSDLPGVRLERVGIERPPRDGDSRADADARATMHTLYERHRPLYEARRDDVFLAKEGLRRRLEVHRYPMQDAQPETAGVGLLDWGSLRRLEPVSRVWGVDRGQPVDRYYIEQFLGAHRSDIRGRVLEVKDPNYTRVFGSGVERSDVVDIAHQNPDATLIADLAQEGSLPESTYDCFILTQTVHIIYDVRSVLRNAARTLKPGGVLLVTLPCVSRMDYESGLDSDFWRFTPASARRVVCEAFGDAEVEVATAGNILACCSFLLGLASQELTREELDHHDPYFPLLVCVRAVKPVTALLARPFRVIALISAYNEEDVISRVLQHLIENGVEAYLLDNRSTDATVEEASRWLGRGLLGVETFPAEAPAGAARFDWAGILRRKKELAGQLDADWFIHHDADEMRESPFPGVTLREAIRWVDRLGYNAIDFRVLNFPPVDDGFRKGDDPRTYFRYWEDPESFDVLQIKAWKNRRGAPFSLVSNGGHEVRFEGRQVFPVPFVLRHYPVRGQAHGTRKVFGERKGRFVEEERSRGWHVQYDDVRDESHQFLRDPADLTFFDLDRIRLELLLEAGRVEVLKAGTPAGSEAPSGGPIVQAVQDAATTVAVEEVQAPRSPSVAEQPPAVPPAAPLVAALLEKEETIRALLESNYRKERSLDTSLLPELALRRQELEFLTKKLPTAAPGPRPAGSRSRLRSRGPSGWGDFRRMTPFSPMWGSDRGLCIDRYYIEAFLEAHAADVRGDVLEIHDSIYAWRYGGSRVRRADVLDVDVMNPNATIVADLRDARVIPSASYDCIILTQTVHVIYEMRDVAAECRRLLKPGGVLLATFPCISRVDVESGLDGDFWRLSESAVRHVFGEAFPDANLETRSHGNLLVCIAFLYGLAAHELTPDELEHFDARHPLDVTLRAVAPAH